MVVALTVVAILVAASVPGVDGVIREHEARRPLRELQELAAVARDRALRTGLPCQVGFDRNGCFAADYIQPYGTDGEYERLLEEARVREAEARYLEASRDRFGGGGEESAAGASAEPAFLERREWPEGVEVQVRPWGRTEWAAVTDGQFARWVFEGNGMSLPLLVRFENGPVRIEARFNSLTGDIEEERTGAN
jgi:hypothetical protein